MEAILQIADFIRHVDEHLKVIIQNYGALTYAVLFLILFCETGLVIMPLLPGDSLLFAAGALSAIESDSLNIYIMLPLLVVAAVLGDAVNYYIGSKVGGQVFKKDSKLFKKAYLEKTQEFYDKYGGKTIILARFVPIVRTFAPFVAGIGEMHYRTFFVYNVVGAVLWVGICGMAGYLFGNIPVIQNNFEYAVLGIIFVSVLPMVFEFFKHRNELKKAIKEEA